MKEGDFRIVDEETNATVTTVEFLNHVDASNSKNIENYIDNLIINKKVKNLKFDFKKVRYIDSSGIGVLIVCKKKLELLGGGLSLIHVNDQVQNLFSTLHIDQILEIQ
jgi:stage II sporulation protein AA (anti-sigma F factor antagonist)